MITHKNNWKKEFVKWDLKEENIIISTYASLKNHINEKYSLVVFDEAHHSTSEKRLSLLKNISTDKTLFLSASMKTEMVKSLNEIFNNLLVYPITLEKAINEDYLKRPVVTLIPLSLKNILNSEEIKIKIGNGTKKIETSYVNMWNYLKDRKSFPNITLIIKCTPKEKYEHLQRNFDYRKSLYLKYRNESSKIALLRAGLDRKNFLGTQKIEAVKDLIAVIGDKRYICFGNSVKDIKKISSKNLIYHKNKDSLEILEKFNSKKINSILAVRMLQEGENLTDIEVGIIAQLDGTERPFIQKFGRVLRAKYPVLYIFYHKDTVDENFLKNVIENTPEECISINQ